MPNHVLRRPWAYALFRTDKCPDPESDETARIVGLAERLGFELREVLATDSDADFAWLFASFELSGISALLVPSVMHVTGWMDVVRYHVDVWTLDPPGRWPRHRTPGITAAFIPGVGSAR
ncbi:hypothetical protein IU474_16720 [Nocardia otitidiscaviarum]|uniref:hypothetical protein n=1 Tax=Nocardia otitidiscaviarum TaxID=1823 RepID=UPI001893082D|nr:hypothetical protein [Nocardia otitidiscaviarum]MBF6238694.1 hypothetical protein [Nocardia otitidiscaviarum]